MSKKPIRLRLLGLVLMLVFGALALFSVVLGVTLDGKEAPAIQGTRDVPRPDVGGPYYESTITTGERTWFPLGVNCTYDSPDDDVGPQTVVNSDWPATFSALGCSAIAIFGVVLLCRPTPSRGLKSAVTAGSAP